MPLTGSWSLATATQQHQQHQKSSNSFSSLAASDTLNSSVAIPANATLVDIHIQLSWSLQAGCSAALRSMVALLLSLLFIFVVLLAYLIGYPVVTALGLLCLSTLRHAAHIKLWGLPSQGKNSNRARGGFLPKARTHIKLVRGYILVVLAVIVATS